MASISKVSHFHLKYLLSNWIREGMSALFLLTSSFETVLCGFQLLVSELKRFPFRDFNNFMGKWTFEDWRGNTTTRYYVVTMETLMSEFYTVHLQMPCYNIRNRAPEKCVQLVPCTDTSCPLSEWCGNLVSVPHPPCHPQALCPTVGLRWQKEEEQFCNSYK